MSRYVNVRLTEKEAKAVRVAAILVLTNDDGPESYGLAPTEAAAGLRACSKITDALLGDQPESD